MFSLNAGELITIIRVTETISLHTVSKSQIEILLYIHAHYFQVYTHFPIYNGTHFPFTRTQNVYKNTAILMTAEAQKRQCS
jgi:hypothetical protein